MITISPHDLQRWQQVAETVAVDAGQLIYRMLAEPRQITSKGFRDVVTDADVAAQHQITTAIRAHFPEHCFFVEEEDSTLPRTGPVRWIIDPIDGTSNYSRGIPIFTVSIAAAVDEEVVVGVIYDALHQELFSAARGQGATLNGQPLAVSAISDLGDALISMDWGRKRAIRTQALAGFQALAHHVRGVRSIGSAALALAWVAAGRLEAYLNYRLSAWDIAAGLLLIQEAGGQATDASGHSLCLVERTTCLGANHFLHRPLLDLIQEIEPVGDD